MSLSHFNATAAARGDGLDPKLRELLERAAVSPDSGCCARAMSGHPAMAPRTLMN
jgi:hypothetical protein